MAQNFEIVLKTEIGICCKYDDLCHDCWSNVHSAIFDFLEEAQSDLDASTSDFAAEYGRIVR